MIFNRIDHSYWIEDLYNQHFNDVHGNFKTNGFFVEIGVGNIISYKGLIEGVAFDENTPYVLECSNTSELLIMGWNGIYIEPVSEFIKQCEIVYTKEKCIDRLKLINLAASDTNETCHIGDGESLINANYTPRISTQQAKLYLGRDIQSKRTTDILLEAKCPSHIDVMSIDVEGYEAKVVRGIDFNIFQPQLIIIETNKVSRDVISKLLPSNYQYANSDDLNTAYKKI